MAAENISPSIFGDIDLNVSLLDFSSKEQPNNKDSSTNTDAVIIYDVDYGERDSCAGGEHCITLDLSLGNRTDNLFCADETPTPTRFIKNCDDVGLFEDLRHVNPFDEGFRRAVEQGTGQTSTTTTTTMTVDNQPNDGDSLHTPQVLYALDATAGSDYCLGVSTRGEEENIDKQNVTVVENRSINTTESLSTNQATCSTTTTSTLGQAGSTAPDSMAVQLIQPQVITWVIPSAQVQAITATTNGTERARSSNYAIPVQTVRPFLLPKPTNENATVSKNKMHSKSPSSTPNTTNVTQASPAPHQHQQHEPSSASLTPTSQLPIKERLKAIVNNKNSNRLRGFAMSATVVSAQPKSKSKVHRDEDCMERRRAAATRYRNKMRKEHEELKQKNSVLQTENKNLRQRIKELEQTLLNKQNDIAQHASQHVPVAEKGACNQIQIPPSSIHLVINVPKMILPTPTQMSHLQQPIAPIPSAYSLEKK